MANVRSSRRIANFSQAAIYTLIFIAILVAANFLANRYNKSFDSTANKRYSLSDQSAKLAHDLNQDMVISYWDRPDSFERARGLFDRYKNLSSKIDVRYQDVDKNRTAAMAAGITTLGTIYVEVGNRRETAKTLTEEDVTSAMMRAIKPGDRMVCFTLGSGESSVEDANASGYAAAKEAVEKNNYKSKVVKLLEKPEVPTDCTLLISAGPRNALSDAGVASLKKYVEAGGRAMFLLDPPLKFGRAVDDNEALLGVLTGWGVTVHKNLVVDAGSAIQQLGPQVPLVTRYEAHAIVSTIKDVPTLFPLPRSLEVKDGAGTKVSALLTTSEDSRATTNLSSSSLQIEGFTDKGPFILAAAGEHTASKGRFVVVGTSGFAANQFLRIRQVGNNDLYMNMVNWLSSDEDVMAIRPKDPEDRPLNMNARQVTLLFYTSVFGLPLLVVLAGLSVWWRRR